MLHRKKLYLFIAVWSIAAFLLCAIFVLPYRRNNRIMFDLERSLSKLTHPSSSFKICEISELGLLTGNGNHCDFFVSQIRSYTSSKMDIEYYYRSKKILNPLTHEMDHVEVTFITLGNLSKKDIDYLPYNIKEMLKSCKLKKGGKYYIVYLFHVGDQPSCDLRCI